MSEDSDTTLEDDKTGITWWCGAVGILGTALALLATSKYGISHHSDSARYISVARSVAEGQGFTFYDGRPEVWSTPLYPMLLSIAAWLRAEILEFSRYLQAVMYGLALFLGARWVASLRLPRTAWVAATLLMLLSTTLFEQATTALTDMLFVTLAMVSLIRLDRFLLRPSLRRLLVAAGCVALAWLARYVGVTLVVLGTVLLFLPRAAGWRERLRDSVIFGAVASAPTVAWLTRNYFVTGAAMPFNVAPTTTFAGYLYLILVIVGNWFLPPRVPEEVRAALGLFILLLTVSALVISASKTLGKEPPPHNGRWSSIRTWSAFAVAYIAFVLVMISRHYATDWPERYLAPAVIPIIGLLAAQATDAFRAISGRAPAVARGFAFVCVLALVWPTRHFVGWMKYAVERGAGGYASDRWQRSETLQYLRAHAPDTEFYTNEPNAIYFHGGSSPARWLPPHGLPGTPADPITALRSLRDSLLGQPEALVVLFEPNPPELDAYNYTKHDLEKLFHTSLIKSFSDGSVYAIRPAVGQSR